ncbi:MAG: acyl-CoA thioesterase [Actinomycetota bacterium]|jgi:acyl-CoA thioesterase-2
MAGHWEEDYDAAQEQADCHAFLTGVHAGERPGEWIGEVPDHWTEGMFGGSIIGQSVTALTRDVPEGRRIHSLHGYFVRPTNGGAPIAYAIDSVRDGRNFSTRRFTASQRGKTTFEGIASFTSDIEGYVYDLPHTSAAPPQADGEVGYGPGGVEALYLGWTEQRDDGTYESTDRKWFRLSNDIGDDVHLHAAYLGFISDWTGIGSRPLLLSWDNDEYGIASLDHAVWFHRPARITDWHFYDLHALVNFGGRSQVRATIRNESGEVVASMAQELLVRVL